MPTLRRILMLSHSLGSYHHRAHAFGEHLARRGYEVDLVMIAERNRFRGTIKSSAGVRIIHSPDLLSGRLRTGWDPWDCAWRILRLSGTKPDLIKCYESRPVSVLPAFALKHLLNVPVVMSWGDWWGRGGTTFERSIGVAHRLDRLFSPVETFFEESFHRHADGLIVLSEALRKRAIALGVPESKIRVIHHGVDLDRVRPGDKAAARQILGIPQDRLLYGYAGKIFPRDAELLMQAHIHVLTRIPDATAVLIGNSNYRTNGDPPPNLIRTGAISYEEVLRWLAACDMLLLPLCDSIANRGRWPSKVPEYMAAQRPVVATAVGDVARLFTDGEAGVLTGATPESFAEGILGLYADPRRDQMGRRGREIAAERLVWSVQTDQVQEFLEQVYNEAHAPFRTATDTIGGSIG